MLAILKKEFNGFLNSLIAYIVITVFLVAIGMFMWVFPESSVLEYGFADMQTLFSMAPFVFLFLIPAITMRTFAEEKREGTIELLLTKPITDLQLILGKYFAALLLALFALLPTLLYYYSVYELGSPEGNVDSAAVVGSYLGLIFLAGVFCAIGVFSSAISDNQIISFVIAVFLCYIIYTGFGLIASIPVWGSFGYYISQLGIAYHYEAISKGLVDSRDVLYFLSVIAIMILATKLVLRSRKW
ncbi:gliding motility-associated ABC transporter permease subunit GldF [Pontibacter akesuensis]|uniref:Protein involved in gliding motility GldF n=1 Tax=Pontibacter akesuensis TaxID=388950 RepID=A0A1I7FLY5_9BACT|nr:gliding motility-associated ABC transporter permease subunit GldF [Pontibacter akesuensis]GHA61535.1 gliding motility-associated ABC transporter permease subunit GldF [Pontibacter akesuensis]SFU37207.1 protein involved in gliding motility GldF [Pontibacter akesuensis]